MKVERLKGRSKTRQEIYIAVRDAKKTTTDWISFQRELATMAFSLLTCIACLAMFFWQEARIEQCRISDIKYHCIMMQGGVGSVGLDSIESWFRNPAIVLSIEREVRQYEQRVQVIAQALAKQETARALEQKHRLEEKIEELNNTKN